MHHACTSDSPSTAQARSCGTLLPPLLLALLMAVLRLPLLGHPTPVDVDELSFMGALGFPRDYPVHHPGYPLWVAMGTVMYAAGFDPYTAFQVWSLAASVAAPVLLYAGLRWIASDRLAWWLALAFGANPLVWFHGTTALSYMAGATVGLIVVGLCFASLTRHSATAAYAAAALLATGISLRADLLIYLGPLLVYVAWRTRWKRGLALLVILAAGGGVFWAWTSYLYGRANAAGVSPHFVHSLDVLLGTSVFRSGVADGLLRNAVKVGVNLAWDYGVAVLLLPPAIWYALRRGRNWPQNVRVVLLLWMTPISLFLLLMHVVQGYFILLLAGGYCLMALALEGMLSRRRAVNVAAFIAICSLVQFVAYPWSVDSTGFKRLVDAKIAFQSASGLRQIDLRAAIHSPGDYWRTAAHDAQSLPVQNPASNPASRFNRAFRRQPGSDLPSSASSHP